MKEELKLRKTIVMVLLFLIKLNFLAIPMYVALHFNFSFPPLQNFLAYLVFQTLKAAGRDASLKGYFLTIQGLPAAIEFSWDSTGWKSLYVLAALVVATPFSNLDKKLRFLSLALPSLFLINYLRILTTIEASIKFGFEHFEIFHGFLWREGLIIAVIALWILYLRTKI